MIKRPKSEHTLGSEVAKPKDGLKYWLEGCDAGEVVLALEQWRPGANAANAITSVRIEVSLEKGPYRRGANAKDIPFARHYLGASKLYPSSIQSVSADLSGPPPLVSWHTFNKKGEQTASLWVGITSSETTGAGLPKSWVQGGLLKTRNAAQGQMQSFSGSPPIKTMVYGEVILDSSQDNDTINKRNYNPQEFSDKYWTRGNISVEADPKTNVARVTWNSTALKSHVKASGSLELKNFHYVKMQATYETSSSVTRVCGTSNGKGGIKNIKVSTGGAALSPALVGDNLEVSLYAPDGGDRFVKKATAFEAKLEHLHYRIQGFGASDGFELWDKYKWTDKDEEW